MAYDQNGRPIPEPQPVVKAGIEAAIQAGQRIAAAEGQPVRMDGALPYAVVPAGMEIKPLGDLLLKVPLRAEADPLFVDTRAFIEYVLRFKTDETLVFADRANNRVRAVIDYHQPAGQPAWRAHTAALNLQTAPEWAEWKGKNRADLDQETFANFLEDHIAQIASPDGKTLLDAILKIRLVRTQSTKAVRNLTTGEVQLAYTDEESGGEANSKMPTELVILVRYFRGMDAFKVPCRLRYRPKGTGVAFSYLINDLDKIQETVFDDLVGQIRMETGVPVYLGTP